jgi:hypothetical protein
MKPISSVTAMQPREAFSETGTRHGGHGLATLESSKVAAWLARQEPGDMDKAAVSRASQHGVGLQVKYESRFPTGPNGESLGFYSVAVGCDVSETGDHLAALADLANFMTPAPLREIEAWLAELSVLVAKRRDDDFTEELRLTAYAGRLAQYPADIARAVTRASYTFWPTWAEMEKRCEVLAGPRRRMMAALERGPQESQPARRPPTQEEKDRIQALVDQMLAAGAGAKKGADE